MILTTHILTGAAVGKNMSNPWLIIISSIALHFALDTFRHGEYLNVKSTVKDTLWKVAIDLAIGFAMVFLAIQFRNFPQATVKNILIGSFFSILPDGLTFLYWKMNFKFLKLYCDFHKKIHPYPSFSEETKWNLRNAVNDIAFSLASILLMIIR